MQLDVISLSNAGRPRLRPYYIDRCDTVGVYGDERFGIRVQNRLPHPVAVRVAVDGRDIASGKQASPDPRDGVPVFKLNGGEVRVFGNWIETAGSGAAFVFSSRENSVAAHVPSESQAYSLGGPDTLTVAVYIDPDTAFSWPDPHFPPRIPVTIPTPVEHPYGTMKESIIYDLPDTAELGDGPGVGAGDYVEHAPLKIADPGKLQLTQVIEVRHVWYDHLVTRLNELGAEPVVKTFAQLGSTPRIPAGARFGVGIHEPIQKYPRTL
jgi:hypothetical protein